MTAVLKEEPPDLMTVDPKIPPALAGLVQHCLEKKPGERFQSARDLAYHLQALETASFSGRVRTLSVKAPHQHLGLAAVSLALLLAIGVVAAYFMGKSVGMQARQLPPSFRRLTFQPQTIFRAGFLLDGQTIVYSAALEGKDADARADIFAFGTMLYEMVTGRKAFEGSSAASVISAVMSATPKAIASLQPLTPPALEQVLLLAWPKIQRRAGRMPRMSRASFAGLRSGRQNRCLRLWQACSAVVAALRSGQLLRRFFCFWQEDFFLIFY